jgi:hypothetical protein
MFLIMAAHSLHPKVPAIEVRGSRTRIKTPLIPGGTPPSMASVFFADLLLNWLLQKDGICAKALCFACTWYELNPAPDPIPNHKSLDFSPILLKGS